MTHERLDAMRLLDLFCCAGGAGMGYHRAGFAVYGVDIEPQPNYPFAFHQGDVLEVIATLIAGGQVEFVWPDGRTESLSRADFIAAHASPPCQFHSITANAHSVAHVDLLEPTRLLLIDLGLPYVIENVEGAPLADPVLLCATMFGLRAADVDGVELQLQRHRLFETSFAVALAPAPCAHDSTPVGGVYGGSRHRKPEHRDNPERRGGYVPARSVRETLLGIDWMRTDHELAQAIPPAYTEWIGRELLEELAALGVLAA